MITRSADEISKMTLFDFLKEHGGAALFLNSCSMMAAIQGLTGEPSTIAYALGIGVSLATNDVINSGDMTGFDGYMEKLKAVARLAYQESYIEIKDLHAKAIAQEGKQKAERLQ